MSKVDIVITKSLAVATDTQDHELKVWDRDECPNIFKTIELWARVNNHIILKVKDKTILQAQ